MTMQIKFIENKAQCFSQIEALLFSTGEEVLEEDMALILSLDLEQTRNLLREMQENYQLSDRGICLLKAENTWRLASKGEHHDMITEYTQVVKKNQISKAALETLAIIAYRQPVTRVVVDEIRGIRSSSTIYWLLENDLIEEAGRLEAPGRPILYRTTRDFLRLVGLESLSQLPEFESFKDDEEKNQEENTSSTEQSVKEEATDQDETC